CPPRCQPGAADPCLREDPAPRRAGSGRLHVPGRSCDPHGGRDDAGVPRLPAHPGPLARVAGDDGGGASGPRRRGRVHARRRRNPHRGPRPARPMTMAGTILLVEDEDEIAAIVSAYLERDGFRVVWASRGVDGLLALEQHEVRLAILDLQLPDADGLDLCRAIREPSRLPIVILTARDEEIDRITGLELGADDYVPKPFSPRELAARVRAVLRRAEPSSLEEIPTLGEVAVDRAARTVAVGGEHVELTV